MSRLQDIQRLYEVLADVQHRLGGPLSLRGCHGRMTWPTRGVYFFFEPGEERSTSGIGPRVVRVGTHALTSTSTRTLWNRLSQHRGVAKSGGGNHRGSIFRLLVGEALLRRDQAHIETWGVGGSPRDVARARNLSPGTVIEVERSTEVAVSGIIGAMPFLFVRVDDPPGPESMRSVIERNAIALLSNLAKDPVDPPSSGWLGHHSGHERVRGSGLWNNRHVEGQYEPSFLDLLARVGSGRSLP
ncbi:hypothetical protein [Anaeromyxobacter diazotrophicus]|uniref:GIY-YIG domain-containing protein n=1 Tax=Anaeromyxobacter diazotrophicus TaxID=2590199 RepID=A0A7I9VKT1_9BACT|nr:hypothetical protein [Anaeromyxobacter diazotrophicus]GEJ56607.1 hypothetical protein AMYX_13480 [Anaeromyxobacter diazotrophicus]